MKKLKNKGRAVIVAKRANPCIGCIFLKNKCSMGASLSFEAINNLQLCTDAGVKYIYE